MENCNLEVGIYSVLILFCVMDMDLSNIKLIFSLTSGNLKSDTIITKIK